MDVYDLYGSLHDVYFTCGECNEESEFGSALQNDDEVLACPECGAEFYVSFTQVGEAKTSTV